MSSASPTHTYRTVSAAWTEGRLENVLQRQKELAALHSSVKKSSSRLINALNQGEFDSIRPMGWPAK